MKRTAFDIPVAIFQKPKKSAISWPHDCMNLEILRFGSIKAAPRAKANIRIPLERNLSFITLLPMKISGEEFRTFSFPDEPLLL